MSLDATALAALLAAPALQPPSGTTAQFDNPPNQNGLAMFVTTFCAVLSTIFVMLRLIGKLRLDRGIKMEDGLMLLAYGAFWGTNFAAYALMKSPGFYVHTWNLHNGDLVYPLYLILIYGCCYSAVLPLLKTAILIDWCNIFVPTNPHHNLFWWGATILATIQCVWGLTCIILLNMQCRPHKAIWEFYLPSKCYSLPSVMLTSASTQVVTDLFMILLPQHIIWKLNLNWQRRTAVSIVFGVGALGFISACLRLQKTVAFSKTEDSMFLIGPLLFWADGEMTCAFFIFSVTCLPKLLSNSPISRRLKSLLGLSKSHSKEESAKIKNSNSYALSRTVGGRNGASRTTTVSLANGTTQVETKSPYYSLEAGDDAASSESQENLRREYKNAANESYAGGKLDANGLVIMRTTHVAVLSETQSNSSQEQSETWK